MRRFNTLLIKPSSFLCNMKCSYCFYNAEESNRTHQYGKFINEETIKSIIEKFIDNTSDELNIVFQGGEPLLIGLDFYKKFVELIKTKNIKNIQVNYSIQTNGLLINNEYANFFKENDFLVGVSIDGTKEIHDKYRLTKDGKPTYNNIIKSLQILNENNVKYNILTVITKELALHIDRVCEDYKKRNFLYTQFIPLIDDDSSYAYSLDNKAFTHYLIKCFDIWHQDVINGQRWYHRYFDGLLNRIALNSYPECTSDKQCGLMYAFESNGDVYPCDFYMTDQFLLGNINLNTIDEIDNKRDAILFLKKDISSKCRNCTYYPLCMGGCKKDKMGNENKYCQAFYKFFEYSYPKFIDIINLIKAGKL